MLGMDYSATLYDESTMQRLADTLSEVLQRLVRSDGETALRDVLEGLSP